MNHIYRVIFNNTAQAQQTASELAKTQGTRASQPVKTITAIAIATALGLLNSHALADGGAGSAGGRAAGGTDVLTGSGNTGANDSEGGGGGGAGITGGDGGGVVVVGVVVGGSSGGIGAGGAGTNGADSYSGGSGGGGGAHGYVGATLPNSAVNGGRGGRGGNDNHGDYGGGGGAGAYGAVITAAVSGGQVASNMTGGNGGNGGNGGGGGGSGGHGLVLQSGGTLSINSRISGGAGGKGGNGSSYGGNGGNGGDGIRVYTAGSSLNLTLQSGANIQAGNGGAGGSAAIGGTAGSAGAAIRFNSGTNILTLHNNVQIQGDVVANGSNDTLNVRGKGITAGNIQGFEKLYFYVQSDTPANATLLNLTESTNISSSTIGVGLEGSNSLLNKGDSINLITTSGTLTTPATLANNTTAMSGISALYKFKLKKPDAKTLQAEVISARINPQTKSLSEARLAGIDFVNRGADLAANIGLENLVKATQNDGIQGFAAIGGGKTRTQTGSHIDVNGAHLMLGVGTQLPNASGTLTLGGFVEGGKGSYDSYNDFANRPDVHASGDTHYYGVGLLAKQQFNNQWFIDGGLRLGKSSMDYYSADLVNAAGNPTSFSGNSNYWGVNVGVGKDIELNENNRLTPYAKLAYTHSSGDSQTIAGSTFDFSAMNSLRSRVGVRWTHQLNETSQLYTDAAWEHEFQGTAKGQVLGFAMPEPSLHGDTGIVNIGVNFTPHENLTIGVGAQGEFGKRNGVSATAKVTYSF